MAIKERWLGVAELPTDIEYKLEQLPALLKELGVQLAYLFGSLIHDPEANDVDLAVWSPDVPAYPLREQIVECLGTDRLGLVDLQQASPISRSEILKSGIALYVADEMSQVEYALQTINFCFDERYRRRRWAEYRREGPAEQLARQSGSISK